MSRLKLTLLRIVKDLNYRKIDCYGVTIDDALKVAACHVSAGRMYTNLQYLVDDGLLRDKFVPGGSGRSFRNKRLYELTAAGLDALNNPKPSFSLLRWLRSL